SRALRGPPALPCPASARWPSLEPSPDLLADRHPRGPALDGEDLGEDGEGDLRRRLRTQIETDGHVDPTERVLPDPVPGEKSEDGLPPTARAEEPDVAHGRGQGMAEHGQIVLVVVGHE